MKRFFNLHIILIAVFSLCLIFSVQTSKISAMEDGFNNSLTAHVILAEGDGGQEGSGIEGDTPFALEDSGMDENLYYALLEIYNEAKGIPEGSIELVTQLRTKMFLEDDIDISCLDLSNKNISSLNNFSWMYFKESMTEINLNNNDIEEIKLQGSVNPFIRVSANLQKLSISNNGLNSIDLTGLTALNYLNLANNNLSAINLSGILASGGDVEIDLSVNNFSKFEDIALPSDENLLNDMNINLMRNNLPDRINTYAKINLILALQGVNSEFGIDVTTKDSIFYYKTGIEHLMLVVSLKDSTVAPIIIYDEQVSDKTNLVEVLGVGDYIAYYSKNNETFASLYDEDDVSTYAYMPQAFRILPVAPTFKLEYNGELVELNSIEELDKPAVLHLYSEDEDSEIYYQMPNSTEWVKADRVEITRGGIFTISLKTVVKDMAGNEVESELAYALVKGRLNLYIPNAVLLLIIAAFTILFFAVALPLVKKYVINK